VRRVVAPPSLSKRRGADLVARPRRKQRERERRAELAGLPRVAAMHDVIARPRASEHDAQPIVDDLAGYEGARMRPIAQTCDRRRAVRRPACGKSAAGNSALNLTRPRRRRASRIHRHGEAGCVEIDREHPRRDINGVPPCDLGKEQRCAVDGAGEIDVADAVPRLTP
jgi:hypothetical protein